MRKLVFGVIGVAALVVAGCSGGAPGTTTYNVDDSAPVGVGKPVEGTLKVALLTPGPVNDAGWNAMAFAGLEGIEKNLGAEVSNQVATDAAIRDAIRSYAQSGYHLVIGHGFEYNEPANEVAGDFPSTYFVSSSGGKISGNAGAFRFYLEQGFYLAGMLAGSMTKTNTVAMVGGPEVESIKSTFRAFAEGARSVNPSVVVIEKFTGKENDVAAAKQLTLQVIAERADFVIHQTNAAAPGVFQACEEKDVYCFGSNLNQNDASPKVIASAVIVAEPAFLELARQVKNGEYSGQIQLMGMEEGAIAFRVNPKLASDIPQNIRQRIDQATLRIISGDLIVPKDEF